MPRTHSKPALAPQTERFAVRVPVTVRPCRREDLPGLEWFGAFRNHRELIGAAFERHARGENLMLVADSNGFPVGQIWIDLQKQARKHAGVIWALRVFPCLQRRGVGTRLLDRAERELRRAGFQFAELAVDIQNLPARRLYEHRGYVPLEQALQEYSYTTPTGDHVTIRELQIRMRKQLRAEPT